MLQKNLGRFGEKIAAVYLRLKGYTVIEKNWRCRLGEIDLVCRQGASLVFVEVKTRSTTAFGFPEEAITSAKLARLEQLAWCYLGEKNLNQTWRIEALSIIFSLSDRRFNLKHLTDL